MIYQFDGISDKFLFRCYLAENLGPLGNLLNVGEYRGPYII